MPNLYMYDVSVIPNIESCLPPTNQSNFNPGQKSLGQ